MFVFSLLFIYLKHLCATFLCPKTPYPGWITIFNHIKKHMKITYTLKAQLNKNVLLTPPPKGAQQEARCASLWRAFESWGATMEKALSWPPTNQASADVGTW